MSSLHLARALPRQRRALAGLLLAAGLAAGAQGAGLPAMAASTAPQAPGSAILVNGVPAVIPQPVSETAGTGGTFTLDTRTKIVTTSRAAAVTADARSLRALVRPASGLPLPVASGSASASDAVILDASGAASLGQEGYTLASTSSSVLITAHTAEGLFRGEQTLRQLLPTQVEDTTRQPQVTWTVPAVSITDTPRYSYRGVMIDVARHFYTVANIKRIIDQAAMYKLSILHLHLSDDQGWRIAIGAYPDLTAVGSTFDGRPGYYTAAQYKQIVAYAAARYITVIPEIDGPAHTGSEVTAMSTGHSPADIPIDPANPADNANVATFLTNVIDTIGAMTPGPYFHIGGDESSLAASQYNHWVTAAADAATADGKIAMGWSQVGADPDLPAGSILQYWSSVSGDDTGDGLKTGLEQGDKLMLSPDDAAYFDQKYDANTPLGLDYVGFVPLSRAYNWNPSATASEIISVNGLSSQITTDPTIGVEAALWADTVPANFTDAQTTTYSDFMLLPRLDAIAEIGWSPQSTHDFTSFSQRVAAQGPRWTDHGYDYYASPEVPWVGTVGQPAVTSPVSGSAATTAPGRISGTGTAGDTITVTAGNTVLARANVAADGSWSARLPQLARGTHQLSVVQADPSDYQSSALPELITVGSKPVLADDWTMDEGQGTTVADSAGAYPGTITGSTVFAPGKDGSGLQFDGSVSPVQTGAPDLAAPWTVGVWVDPAATNASATLLSGSNSSIKLQQYNGTGVVGITQSGVADYTSAYTAPLNTWTYLTLVDNGTTTTVYANGQPVSTIDASIPLGRAEIGTPSAQNPLNASVDELTVFSDALTPAEVTSLYTGSGMTGGVAAPVITSPLSGSAVASSPRVITGTGTPRDTVTVWVGQSIACTAAVSASGAWACAPAKPLPAFVPGSTGDGSASGADTITATQSAASSPWDVGASATVTIGASPQLDDYWQLGTLTGTSLSDAGPAGYTGTVTGDTTLGPDPTLPAGTSGDAATFDGSVSPLTTSAPNLDAPWTVGVWVNPASTQASAPLLSGNGASLRLQEWDGTGDVGITQAGVADWPSEYSAPLNTWTYLTVVDNGTDTAVYANGQQVSTIDATISLGRQQIGSQDSGDVTDAKVGELTVFSGAFSSAQVSALYSAGGSGESSSLPGLADDWTMAPGPGLTAADEAGPYSGTAAGSSAVVTGHNGPARSWNGTASPVTTAAPDLPAPWSAGVWVDPAAASASASIISGADTAVRLQQPGSGDVGISDTGAADYASGYAVPLNTWTYLTLVDNGATTTVYANGRAVGTIDASIPLGRASIGSTASDPADEALQDLSVYGNALTSSQVAALYQAGGAASARLR